MEDDYDIYDINDHYGSDIDEGYEDYESNPYDGTYSED